VDINGWQHWWNPERGTWCVNENRDSYWDEVLSTVQNLLFSKACVSESDFPLNPTDEEKRFGYFYNGELYLWTGTNGTVRNGQYRSFGVVQGERGVGVSSIAQTSTSNVDGGKNEITVTLTNGDSYKFFIYNGTGRNKGYYYRTLDELKQAVPSPTVTDWAIVDGSVYVCDEAGVWKDTTYSWKPIKLNPFVTELNKMDMPTSTGYLYWNGKSFGWKTPVVNNGGGNTGGGTSIDLSEYSWWGRKFAPASKMITGEMSAVTSIEFQSTKGETTIRKKLYLDENGDLCFNGNLYATGGITALGSGGGTSGGGGGSTTGTLYVGSTSNNLGFDGSKNMNLYFGDGLKVEKSDNQITVSATGGGTGGGIRIKRNGSTLKDSNGDVLSCTSINFKYGENWNSTPILINSDNEISVDLSVVANNGNGSSSSSSYPLTIYNGSSNTDYITYDGSSSAYLRFKSGFSISKTGLGYEISVSGGGSGSSSRIKKIKLFNSHFDYSFETIELGSADTIGFMAGDNITLEAIVKEYTNVIKISAKGGNDGSGGSTSTSVSWSDVTNKPSTFTPSSHTHSTSDINGLSNYVQGITVNNANKATQLTNPRLIWGQSFDGTGNINGHFYMGTGGGGSIQFYMNNGNMLDRTNNTLHIGYGLKEPSDGEINLDANVTKIYTDNYSKHYDFKSNVFDVNSNQIHFGSETNGGKISWDAANNAFKIEGNVYATGGITALGVSNNATTSNNVDFTFRSVTSPTYKFNNGSYLTEESINNIHTLKLYHINSSQYIRLSDSYEYIDDGNNFLGHVIGSSCMSFMNADWYYFDNTIVAPEIYTKIISFFDIDGNQCTTLSDIAVSNVSSQTKLLFTINGIQYSVNAN
jgi:hypothetical protein